MDEAEVEAKWLSMFDRTSSSVKVWADVVVFHYEEISLLPMLRLEMAPLRRHG